MSFSDTSYVRTLISLFCLLIAVGCASTVWAEGGGSNIGIQYGLSVPDASNTSPYWAFGVSGSAPVGANMGLGGYYLETAGSQGKGGRSFGYSLAGIEGTYHIPGGAGETYVGLRVGITKIREIVSNTEFILSPYHYGIAVGYNYYLTNYFALGFEGAYLMVGRSKTTSSGLTQEEDPFNLINFLASIKFRF